MKRVHKQLLSFVVLLVAIMAAYPASSLSGGSPKPQSQPTFGPQIVLSFEKSEGSADWMSWQSGASDIGGVREILSASAQSCEAGHHLCAAKQGCCPDGYNYACRYNECTKAAKKCYKVRTQEEEYDLRRCCTGGLIECP